MTTTLWKLPVPSTALFRDAEFEKLPQRACALRCEYEDDDGRVVELKLLFDGIEAFKCTYMHACTVEMISSAYDKVVDVGSTDWLNVVRSQVLSSGAQNVAELRHLMIYFDDGPCYEFICRTFSVE